MTFECYFYFHFYTKLKSGCENTSAVYSSVSSISCMKERTEGTRSGEQSMTKFCEREKSWKC